MRRGLPVDGCVDREDLDADLYGNTEVPLYVLNVTYPLVSDEFLDFCDGKDEILVIEEGQPEFIEQGLSTILYRAGSDVKVRGKGLWIGLVLKTRARPYCEALMEEGILCKETHENVIRFAPPLTITKRELNMALRRVEKVFKKLEG